MEKLIYLLWRERGSPIAPFREKLLSGTTPALLARTRGEFTVHLDDLEEGFTTQPDAPSLAAVVSLWVDSVDEAPSLEEPLRALAPELWGYLVTESVPLEYQTRSWPDGERSPFVIAMAAFEKPERLDDESFIRHWHGSHTPKSLEIHPLRRYIRNVVARRITPEGRDFRGIVPESFDSAADFLDPRRLYGGGHEKYGGFEATLRLMVEDQKAFLDLDRVHVTLMSETILRS